MNLFKITCNDTSATVVYVIAAHAEEALFLFGMTGGISKASVVLVEKLEGHLIMPT